jgi:hypothetical protein
VAWKEVEERKEAVAQKVETEQRDHLAQEKVVEEQRQSLSKGLSGLTLTIPAPSSITGAVSGLSMQSKRRRKATEEDSLVSQYILFI